MHFTKVITTALAASALVVGLFAGAFPARAAIAGFHASYFSESSFLALGPGQSGQFVVGYTNTGDQGWVKGASGPQANLATAAPLENTLDYSAGWAVGWLSPNRYSAQQSDLVAPGQIGYFVYNVKVPVGTAAGLHYFYGRPLIEGVTWLEDFGYYHVANVQGSTITITSTNPPSPSTNATPVVNGGGAPVSAAVTINDGTMQVGSGTAAADGTFGVTVSALGGGSHTLTACSTNGCSAGFTYVVDTGAPTVTGATPNGISQVTVTYSEPMVCTEIANISNYAIRKTFDASQTVAVSSATANTGCTAATLGTAAMTNGQQYTVTVNSVHDQAGNLVNSGANSAAFTVSDTTRPTATAAIYPSPSTLRITYSEPMKTSGTAGITTQTNYNLDSVSGTVAFTGPGTASGDSSSVTFTLSSSPPNNGNHFVDIFNVQDLAGNVINPNPATVTANYQPGTNRPNITGVSASTVSAVVVAYSALMKCASGSTNNDNAGNAAKYTINKTDGSPGPVVASVTCGQDSGGNTTASLNLATPLTASQAYSLTTRDVQDQYGNILNPNPTVTSFMFTADTTRPTVTGTSTSGQTQFTVTYSEAMQTGGGANAIDNKANYTSTDAAFGTVIAAGSCSANPGATAATCTVSTQSGTKPLTVSNVRDVAGNDLNPNPTVTNVNFVDVTPPTATGATATHGTTSDTATVTYSEAMNTTGGANGANSVLNPANYKIDGAALPSGPVLTCNSGTSCTMVTISNLALTTFAPTGSPHSIQISGVTDVAGNVISPNPTTRNVISQ